jgi:hypothetical protein
MPARFNKGQSITTTNATREFNGPKRMKTANSMNGMPGYIDAHQREDMGGAKGGKGFGPHREGPVGEKGGSGAKSMAKAGDSPGMSTKNYKSASTDSAGTLKNANETGSHKIHTGNRTRGMPGQKAPPTSRGILGGTVRAAGIDRQNPFKGGGIHAVVPRGSGGKMEKLRGHTQTASEGRRKSSMY